MTARLAGLMFGREYAKHVFERFVANEIAAKRKPGYEPPATGDLVVFLEHWREKRDGLRQQTDRAIRHHGALYGLKFQSGARAGYLAEVSDSLFQILDEMAGAVGDDNLFAAARDSVLAAAEHFIFPENSTKYEGFGADVADIFDCVRDTAAANQNWVGAENGWVRAG
ncbi:hypothetical protein ACP4J4_02635 [Aureimonas ureilytica]|uniref:hypothetical protein n=1 Tax=Aureimonas ureilytica TaxID=401562 RepID=UPI003CE9FD21